MEQVLSENMQKHSDSELKKYKLLEMRDSTLAR